jgi:hypothetical protein
MPALPDVLKVLRIQYEFQIDEDLKAICREFMFYTGAGMSGADIDTLAGNIASSFATNLVPEMDDSRSLIAVVVTDLTTPLAPVGLWTGSHAGSRAGNKLPASAAVVESKEIVRRFRGGHGRIYWPFGVQADMQDDQTWKAAFQTEVAVALGNHFTDWSTDLVPGCTSVAPVCVSYYKGFTVHTGTTGRARNVSTPLAIPVVDLIVSTLIRVGIGQIRKRLLGLA